MKIEKELKKVGIQQLSEITPLEKNILVQSVASCLINAFPRMNLDYNKFAMKLYNCNMYRANVQEGFNKVNYFYKNKSIYFDNSINLEQLDGDILHECIHYIQDNRNIEGNLNQIGLCEFSEYKIHGFELNELAVKYIVNKITNNQAQKRDYLDVLLQQILFVVGEEIFVTSTIYGDNQFKEKFMYMFSEEDIFYKMNNIIDNIASKEKQASELVKYKEIKQEKYDSKIEKLNEEIKNNFEKLQKEMFTKYFNTTIKFIDKLEEIDECQETMNNYKNLLVCSKQEEYDYLIKEMSNALDKKAMEIYRRDSKNSLTVFNNNPIISLIRSIRKAFFKTES